MGDWLDAMESRNKKQAKYDKNNTTGFYMKLNIHTDMDIIRWLWARRLKQGAVKQLIRREIARGSFHSHGSGTVVKGTVE